MSEGRYSVLVFCIFGLCNILFFTGDFFLTMRTSRMTLLIYANPTIELQVFLGGGRGGLEGARSTGTLEHRSLIYCGFFLFWQKKKKKNWNPEGGFVSLCVCVVLLFANLKNMTMM